MVINNKMDSSMSNDHNSTHCNMEHVISEYYEKLKKALSKDEECYTAANKLHNERYLDYKVHMENLSDKICKVQEEIGKTEMRIKMDDEKKKSLQTEISQQEIEMASKMKEVKALHQKADLLDTLVKEKEAQVNNSKGTGDRIASLVETTQRHLGFRITRVNPESLVFVFTQIDRREPSREYILELSLNKDHQYVLHRTVPDVGNLSFLEKRLNETNNLLGFLVHLRSLFCKH